MRTIGRLADNQRIAEWMQANYANVFDDSYLETSCKIALQRLEPIRKP